MLELYGFRQRYRHPLLADPFSGHDLSFSVLSEASNHAFAETFIPSLSGIRRGVIYARVNGSQKRKIAHDLQRQVELLSARARAVLSKKFRGLRGIQFNFIVRRIQMTPRGEETTFQIFPIFIDSNYSYNASASLEALVEYSYSACAAGSTII